MLCFLKIMGFKLPVHSQNSSQRFGYQTIGVRSHESRSVYREERTIIIVSSHQRTTVPPDYTMILRKLLRTVYPLMGVRAPMRLRAPFSACDSILKIHFLAAKNTIFVINVKFGVIIHFATGPQN